MKFQIRADDLANEEATNAVNEMAPGAGNSTAHEGEMKLLVAVAA